jgi:hypothetical protein
MMGYTKLFNSIVTSTIWQEDLPTKVVWITLLAMSDSDGTVEGSVPGLAHIAGVSVEECERSLATLQKPDRYSRTPDHDGRRIETIDGGWFILNRAKYRDKNWQDEKVERHRQANSRYYERQKTSDNPNPKLSESDRIGDKKEKEKEKIKTQTSLSKLENSSDQATDFGESGSKENPSPKAPSHEAKKLAALLSGEISKNAPHFRITTAQQRKWSGIADLMLRRDHRSYDEIASIIQWCQADEFWRSNVLSMQKVREKFDQLELKRGTAGGKSRAQTVPSPDYTRGLEGFVVRGASNEGNL